MDTVWTVEREKERERGEREREGRWKGGIKEGRRIKKTMEES